MPGLEVMLHLCGVLVGLRSEPGECKAFSFKHFRDATAVSRWFLGVVFAP